MTEIIPPSQKALEEALRLSEEVIRNIELSELPLVNIALKASRLARLLNELDIQKIMECEASGYASTPEGLPPETWRLAIAAGRKREVKDSDTDKLKEYVYLESIGELEQEIRMEEIALEAARDPNVSISSANPYQSVQLPTGNWLERQQIKGKVNQASKRLQSRRALIYRYALRKHYELKFSGIADDVFSRIRDRVDSAIGDIVPDAAQKLSAVYDNLRSENPEDWSNAVHSCRRILQDLADKVFPPQEDRNVVVNEQKRTIKLGRDNYINRIMAFVEDHSTSQRFQGLVGSHLTFLGDRLDSVFKAAQKGSHDIIVKQEEADRYVVYTYLVVGDILSLIL